MGFFTWTLADRPIQYNRSGTDFLQKCKLSYGGHGYLVTPDGTVYEEKDYEGYGIFSGHDAYDLVVDWNRGRIQAALYNKTRRKKVEQVFFDLAKAIDKDRESDCPSIAAHYADKGLCGTYMKTDWKRCLGIEIACDEMSNAMLPFPIKITGARPKRPYKDLPASVACQ